MGCCLAGSSYSASIESFAVDCTSRCDDDKMKRGGGRAEEEEIEWGYEKARLQRKMKRSFTG